MHIFSVGFDQSKNPLRAEPEDSSKIFPANEDYFYYFKKIKNDWLMVEDEDGNLFWIKCYDKKGNLSIELYYDA
ncbi:hypothetical protein [uncultured Chryseobacterium sp.]|uniref:hypothetical protein n=1 Tax=uncultured Chryseobacterium sp. TaxID=259322 RepID=UPI0025FB8066|nr:hypothetical protein [uncultured Chryseobacterium sp.]